jgi:ABC-type nitrate/sulfonate/bicarbonate transport system permease component
MTPFVRTLSTWALRPWAWTLRVVPEIVVIVLAVLQLGRLEPVRHIITIVIVMSD